MYEADLHKEGEKFEEKKKMIDAKSLNAMMYLKISNFTIKSCH